MKKQNNVMHVEKKKKKKRVEICQNLNLNLHFLTENEKEEVFLILKESLRCPFWYFHLQASVGEASQALTTKQPFSLQKIHRFHY